ncbi:hypothetical protein ACJIZ3_003821 [Penstemon smallii]|uniref:Uncharacterized protein n=1 Tax=Penstemon smallii TaxID=265156 RepID=A0ABD3S0G4_9LAMI
MSSGSLAAATSMVDDDHHLDLAMADANLISPQDYKDQALQVLKSDLLAKLNKEVKSLDEDSWMFDGPRSRIHLISGPEKKLNSYKLTVHNSLTPEEIVN